MPKPELLDLPNELLAVIVGYAARLDDAKVTGYGAAKRLKATHRRFREAADTHIFRRYCFSVGPNQLRNGNNQLFKKLTLSPALKHAQIIDFHVVRPLDDYRESMDLDQETEASLLNYAVIDTHARFKRRFDAATKYSRHDGQLLYEKLERIRAGSAELAWLVPWITVFAPKARHVAMESQVAAHLSRYLQSSTFKQILQTFERLPTNHIQSLDIRGFGDPWVFDLLEHWNILPAALVLTVQGNGWEYSSRSQSRVLSRLGARPDFSVFAITLEDGGPSLAQPWQDVAFTLLSIQTWARLIKDLAKEWKGQTVSLMRTKAIHDWQTILDAAADDDEMEHPQFVNINGLLDDSVETARIGFRRKMLGDGPYVQLE